MSSLARISLLLEDLKDELKDGRLEPTAGMTRANELAETVVDFIADLTVGPEPPTDMLDQVAEAASQAQQGYEAVRERLTADSPEQDTLGLLAGYWEMRAVAAGLEASVVRNRSAMLAAVPAPEPSAPALLAPSSAPALLAPSTTKVSTAATDLAEVGPGWGLGPPASGDRPETRPGDVPAPPGTEDFGTGAEVKHALGGIRRPAGVLSIGKASTTAKGTDPLDRVRRLGSHKARPGEESGDG